MHERCTRGAREGHERGTRGAREGHERCTRGASLNFPTTLIRLITTILDKSFPFSCFICGSQESLSSITTPRNFTSVTRFSL